MENNPVYVHLMQGSCQPSKRAERLLSAVIGIVGGCAAVGAAYYVEANGWFFPAIVPWLALGIISVSYITVAPSLALIITTLFTVKSASQESLAVLWLTPISAKWIVDGYIGAVTDRLHIQRAIGIGLVPQAVATTAYFFGSYFMFFDCFGPNGVGSCGPGIAYTRLIFGSVAAVPIVGMLAVIGVLLEQFAVIMGVWAGLRWREKAIGAAGGIILVVWLIFVSLLTLIGLLYARDYVFEVVFVVVGITAVCIPILWLFNRFALQDTYRVARRMRLMR